MTLSNSINTALQNSGHDVVIKLLSVTDKTQRNPALKLLQSISVLCQDYAALSERVFVSESTVRKFTGSMSKKLV